ncbi:MAG: AfsR/SARP family transcriptional regulator [Solirubrobacteraceae bacterium]
MGESLELGILGPLQVRLSGNPPVALGGVRQRAVLAVLALNAGQVVSTDRLVDDLWGENPPARAVHTIRCSSRACAPSWPARATG